MDYQSWSILRDFLVSWYLAFFMSYRAFRSVMRDTVSAGLQWEAYFLHYSSRTISNIPHWLSTTLKMSTFDCYKNPGNEAWQLYFGFLFVFKILVKKIEAQMLSTLSKITQLLNGKWQNKFYNMIPELTSGITGSHCYLQVCRFMYLC